MKITLQSLVVLAAGIQLQVAQATFTGTAYYYDLGPSGYTGTCGYTNFNTDLIVALPSGHYAAGAKCGKNIQITYGGANVIAKVVDTCGACGTNDVDLSPSAFAALAPLSSGLIPNVNWVFL